VLALRWVRSPLLLLMLVLVLLWLTGWVGGAVVVHRSVLRRSTTGWSFHNIPLLGFLVGVDGIIRDHDIADKLWKCPSSVECHAHLQRSFFFLSVSTWSGAYCTRWLNCLE
jgi:hypothetical protein